MRVCDTGKPIINCSGRCTIIANQRNNDYPMAPELMTITPESTGPKQHELRAKYFAAGCPYNRKLICSFLLKKRYVVLGHMLRFYLDRGMKLIKVTRGIKFTANPILRNTLKTTPTSAISLRKTMGKKFSINL